MDSTEEKGENAQNIETCPSDDGFDAWGGTIWKWSLGFEK